MNYFQLQYMKLIRLSLVAETTLKIKVQIKKILNKQGSSLWEKNHICMIVPIDLQYCLIVIKLRP